jgi:hypothetical protein
MAQVTDDLITRFVLDDQYSSKADNIASATARVARAQGMVKPPVVDDAQHAAQIAKVKQYGAVQQAVDADAIQRVQRVRAASAAAAQSYMSMGAAAATGLGIAALAIGLAGKAAFDFIHNIPVVKEAVEGVSTAMNKALDVAFKPYADELTRITAIAERGGVFQDLANDLQAALNVDGGNLEEIFVNIVAALKTGIQLMGQLFDGIGLLAPSLGAAFDLMVNTSGVGDQFNANKQAVRTAMGTGEMGLSRDAKLAGAGSGALQGALFGVGAGTGDLGAALAGADVKDMKRPLDDIARNTAKMVDQQAQIQDAILGGGTVGRGAVSEVNISKMTGGAGRRGGSDPFQQVTDSFKRAVDEYIGSQLSRMLLNPGR